MSDQVSVKCTFGIDSPLSAEQKRLLMNHLKNEFETHVQVLRNEGVLTPDEESFDEISLTGPTNIHVSFE